MCVDGENTKDPGDAQDRQQHSHRLGSEPTRTAGGERGRLRAVSVVLSDTLDQTTSFRATSVHVQVNSLDSVSISVNLVAFRANAGYNPRDRNQNADVDLDRESTRISSVRGHTHTPRTRVERQAAPGLSQTV